MISYEVVLQQLEKQIAEAKSARNEQQMREAITAVRALCDVVLVLPAESLKSKVQQMPVQAHVPQMFVPETTSPKLEEDDGANGDSIFDF